MQSTRYSCHTLMRIEFSRQILKTQISNLVKIRPVIVELFRADGRTDGQTDMTQLILAYRNFANATKNHILSFCCEILGPEMIGFIIFRHGTTYLRSNQRH